MKKYSTVLLSSAMLLASLTYAPKVQAYSSYGRWYNANRNNQTSSTPVAPTTSEQENQSSQPSEETPSPAIDPTIVQEPLSTQVDGQEVSVFYNRTDSQRGSTIMYAIWSEANGQDDLQWYTAGESITTISLKNPKNYGTYLIHSYIMVNNRLTFLEEKKFVLDRPHFPPANQANSPAQPGQAEQTSSEKKPDKPEEIPQAPSPTVSASVSTPGFINIQVDHVPAGITEVKIPVWSVNNGQDDLVWYNATRNADGTYGLQVDLKRHKLDTGTYAIHVYGKEANSSLKIMTHTQISVEKEQLPVNPDPKLAITSLNPANGTYQVQVTPQVGGKSIKKVDVATWSTDNQSNLKWRVASYQNGVYTTNVNFSEHQSINGVYHNHVYITYGDGSRLGYAAEKVNLTNARASIQVTTTFSSQGNFRVSLDNIYGGGNVSYAVWSDENGQDDLRWYTATKAGDKTYTGDIPLQFHKGTGKYHLHVYQNGKGLIPSTFQVTTSQLPAPKPVVRTEPNTYPVGQCTWGAKELAPWIPNYLGNAKYWASNAREQGFEVGTTPRVGAVAVWTDGQFGHVGVVTAVDSPTRIRLKESNFNGHQYVGDFRGWFNPVTGGIVAYIYPN
ncbi:GBS Bsp-like repeat-containing protein [Streptococcus sp. ZJ93]|uniref:GBS Bsp-like repeat-containing protein n=1 Tax=Streptococcus handemini TaxID=3161188 RepID=UPI0034D3B560